MVKRKLQGSNDFEFIDDTAAAAGADVLPFVLASLLHAEALSLSLAPVQALVDFVLR